LPEADNSCIKTFMLEFVADTRIHEEVIRSQVFRAHKSVWVATSDMKDLHVAKGPRVVPFLEILSDLIARRVEIRLLHAKEPGPNFRADFDRYPNLLHGMERILCPRVHFKSVVVDGRFAYTGSANLTGAGMGAKSVTRRNFEAGIITDEPALVEKIAEQFDQVWRGDHCAGCQRKRFCADYRALQGRE
jgi:phosphatidylserine/phosphatidylglycerophosphate/cardiolipin synthase-like enzyme